MKFKLLWLSALVVELLQFLNLLPAPFITKYGGNVLFGDLNVFFPQSHTNPISYNS